MLGKAKIHQTQNNRKDVSVKKKKVLRVSWVSDVQVKLASKCKRKALNLTMRKLAEVIRQ